MKKEVHATPEMGDVFHKQQSPTACPVKVIYLFQKKELVTILFLFKKHHV